MTSHALKSTCCVSICRAQAFPAAMASFRGELATTIPDARLSIRSFLVNTILPIRLVRRTAYFPRWYNGVLRCNAICTGPPPAVRGPARASAPALRFLGVSDRGPAFNRKVRTKSLCKCPVRLWLPCHGDISMLSIRALFWSTRSFLGYVHRTVPPHHSHSTAPKLCLFQSAWRPECTRNVGSDRHNRGR